MPIDLAEDLGRILSDPAGVSVPATYTPDGGASYGVNVLRLAPKPITRFGDSNVAATLARFVVQASEVSAPGSGDRIVVGSEIFAVQGVPVLNPHGVSWSVEARAADPIALDRQIKLQQHGTIQGAAARRPGWVDLVTVPASFDAVGSEEKLQAGIVEGATMARFTILWSETVAVVKPKDRLLLDGKPWNITGVIELGRSQWLEIMADQSDLDDAD